MFGKLLKTLRKSKRLTQAELADMCDVTQQAVGLWERDRNLPDTAKIALLADIFEVSTDYLLEPINPSSPTKSTAPVSVTANTATDTLTAEEREHLAMLRALSPEARRRVERNLKGEYEDSIDSQLQETTCC